MTRVSLPGTSRRPVLGAGLVGLLLALVLGATPAEARRGFNPRAYYQEFYSTTGTGDGSSATDAGTVDPGATVRPVHDASNWAVAQGSLREYWDEWKAQSGVDDLGHSTGLSGAVVIGGYRADEVPVEFRAWVIDRAARDGVLVVGNAWDVATVAAQEEERVRAVEQAAAEAAEAAERARDDAEASTDSTDGATSPEGTGDDTRADAGDVGAAGTDPSSDSWSRPDDGSIAGDGGATPDGNDAGNSGDAGGTSPDPGSSAGTPAATPAGKSTPSARTPTEYRYGSDHGRQELDVYLPTQGRGPFPLIVFFHGGGFYQGDKKSVKDFLPMLDRGYAMASCNYRLDKDPVSAAQDSRKAVQFLREKIRSDPANFPFDARRIAAAGASAGGYLAALLGANGNRHGARVNAVIDLAGPTDFASFGGQFFYNANLGPRTFAFKVPSNLGDLAGALGGIAKGGIPKGVDVSSVVGKAGGALGGLGGGALSPDYSAIRSASGSHPPAMIRHGRNDPIIPLQQSAGYAQALKKAGVYVWYEVVDASHGLTPELVRKVMDEADEFLSCRQVWGSGPCP